MHVFDRRTDRQTDGKREGRTKLSSLDRVCILWHPCSAVKNVTTDRFILFDSVLGRRLKKVVNFLEKKVHPVSDLASGFSDLEMTWPNAPALAFAPDDLHVPHDPSDLIIIINISLLASK